MASRSANDVARAVNSFDHYSLGDQQAITAVIEEYFTSREEESEEFDSTGKNKYNR